MLVPLSRVHCFSALFGYDCSLGWLLRLRVRLEQRALFPLWLPYHSGFKTRSENILLAGLGAVRTALLLLQALIGHSSLSVWVSGSYLPRQSFECDQQQKHMWALVGYATTLCLGYQ